MKDKRQREQIQSDAEDIMSAKIEIDMLIAQGFLENGPDWVKAWYQLELKWADNDLSYITMPEASVKELVKRSIGNTDVFGLVKFVAASRVQVGVNIPAGLNELVVDFLNGRNVHAPKKRGRRRTTWGRDYVIARTIQMLANRWDDRRPFHRSGSQNAVASISQIVHEALRQTEIGLVDVDRIQKIYSEARRNGNLNIANHLIIDSMFENYEDAKWI